MNKIVIVGMSLALLAGCATEEKYNKELDGFINQPASSVEAKFGKPSAAKIFGNGDEVITYTKVSESYVPSEYYMYNNNFIPGQEVVYSPFTGDYDFYPFEQSFGYTVSRSCQTSFLVEQGVVSGWRWKGNDCVAY